ncbi:MAG: hypothetical protein FWC61_01090 [Proteobacteria bacterium]|nr:hypothetical protein [Pseudomonadota bacterium]
MSDFEITKEQEKQWNKRAYKTILMGIMWANGIVIGLGCAGYLCDLYDYNYGCDTIYYGKHEGEWDDDWSTNRKVQGQPAPKFKDAFFDAYTQNGEMFPYAMGLHGVATVLGAFYGVRRIRKKYSLWVATQQSKKTA